MAKRALDASPADAKRLRTSLEQEGSKSTAGDDSVLERIKDVPLPDKIKALPHVMSLIARLAMTPEEALKEALATHELDWMKQIISNFDCNLTETVVQAAATNQEDVIRLVLFGFLIHAHTTRWELQDDTQTLVEKAILTAAHNGHLRIVKTLLYTIVALWMDPFSTIRDVIDEAAANGQLTVVKYMAQHTVSLRYDTKYSFWPEVDTLSKAILGGHTDVAEFLVNESQILWSLQSAYVAAVDQGQTALAGRICEVYPEQMRGRSLFLDLASWGHLEAVKYLYNNGCDDSGLVGKAFAAAAGDAHNDVVKFLVGTGRVNSEAFDKAFKRACYGFKTIDTVTFLYNLKRVSPQGINRGFESSNDVAVMKLLYDKEKISDKVVATAFTNALDRHLIGDSSVIRYLCKKPGISSELIGKAFVSAALHLNTDLVNFLKDNERLSSKTMGQAFVEAVKLHKVDMMKLLYDEHRTPGEALVQALMESAHRRRIDLVKDIVKFLLARENTPRNFMHEAFVAAARHGQMSILEIVHQSQVTDLPLKVLKDALDVAAGNSKIEDFIRKLVCDQVFKEIL